MYLCAWAFLSFHSNLFGNLISVKRLIFTSGQKKHSCLDGSLEVVWMAEDERAMIPWPRYVEYLLRSDCGDL